MSDPRQVLRGYLADNDIDYEETGDGLFSFHFANDAGATNLVVAFSGDNDDVLDVSAVDYDGKGLAQGLDSAGIAISAVAGATRIVFSDGGSVSTVIRRDGILPGELSEDWFAF